MPRNSAPSLRQLYEEWVEEQIEDYKDSVNRSDLLRLADEVVEELRMSPGGQYQLTEMLLWTAVDRKIFKLLKLPGYRTWCSARRAASRPFLTLEHIERADESEAPSQPQQSPVTIKVLAR